MKETVGEIGEFGLIECIRKWISRYSAPGPEIQLGVGDDASVLETTPRRQWVVTCDTFVQGRHFLPEVMSPYDIGWRLMAANISDVAAMGAAPSFALISLGLPKTTPVGWLKDLYRGLIEALKPYGGGIIGGNITSVDSETFVDVTLIGEVEAGRFLSRAGARPGDDILVTGFPGQAALALQNLKEKGGRPGAKRDPLVRSYCRPPGRVHEGVAAATSGHATAMIDISDGLLGDLGHICLQSGVGAEVVKARIPLSKRMRNEARKRGTDPYHWILGPSDDYELIITCRPCGTEKLSQRITQIGGVPVNVIGRITDRKGRMELLLEDGSRKHVSSRGWDHFRR